MCSAVVPLGGTCLQLVEASGARPPAASFGVAPRPECTDFRMAAWKRSATEWPSAQHPPLPTSSSPPWAHLAWESRQCRPGENFAGRQRMENRTGNQPGRTRTVDTRPILAGRSLSLDSSCIVCWDRYHRSRWKVHVLALQRTDGDTLSLELPGSARATKRRCR